MAGSQSMAWDGDDNGIYPAKRGRAWTLGRDGNKFFGRLMIRLVGAIQSQQFPVFLKQILFARRRRPARRLSAPPQSHRQIVPPRRRRPPGCRRGGHAIVRQFAGTLGIFDGLNTIPDVCVRTGRQQPGQIVQDIGESGLICRPFGIGRSLRPPCPFGAARCRGCCGLSR